MLGSSDNKSEFLIQVGLTQACPCSYLPQKQEQLLLLTDRSQLNGDYYQQLLQQGFRRSGNDIYRPHCFLCHQCQSIRIFTPDFKPSRSQKRLLNKNSKLSVRVQHTPPDGSYELYAQYISTQHTDGAMYPPSKTQFNGFIACEWLTMQYLEIRDNNQLIAVAIIDPLPGANSAMYCFYNPKYAQYSLGTYAILQLIQQTQQQGKQWLYLGYQIDSCKKMNYKTKFRPYQRLINGTWENFEQ